MKKPCSEMFCLRNQDITDAKAFFYLFFMSNSGYLNYLHFHNKKITQSDLFELIRDPKVYNSGDFQKLITLLNIYFPELNDEYERVNKARSEVVKYMNVDKEINVKDFVKVQESFENVAMNFKKEISELARNMKNE